MEGEGRGRGPCREAGGGFRPEEGGGEKATEDGRGRRQGAGRGGAPAGHLQGEGGGRGAGRGEAGVREGGGRPGGGSDAEAGGSRGKGPGAGLARRDRRAECEAGEPPRPEGRRGGKGVRLGEQDGAAGGWGVPARSGKGRGEGRGGQGRPAPPGDTRAPKPWGGRLGSGDLAGREASCANWNTRDRAVPSEAGQASCQPVGTPALWGEAGSRDRGRRGRGLRAPAWGDSDGTRDGAGSEGAARGRRKGRAAGKGEGGDGRQRGRGPEGTAGARSAAPGRTGLAARSWRRRDGGSWRPAAVPSAASGDRRTRTGAGVQRRGERGRRRAGPQGWGRLPGRAAGWPGR